MARPGWEWGAAAAGGRRRRRAPALPDENKEKESPKSRGKWKKFTRRTRQWNHRAAVRALELQSLKVPPKTLNWSALHYFS